MKITPSQRIRLSWLAGIIDGEGSVGAYMTSQGHYMYGVTVLNTDEGILTATENIYKELDIKYCRYNRSHYLKKYPYSHQGSLPCYEITIRRRVDTKKILELVLPYLEGVKKQRAIKTLEVLEATKKPIYSYLCRECRKRFSPGRKRTPPPRFCSLKCWHDWSIGEKNPNYRHGQRVRGVTTEREAPVRGEATV